jgi:hypothetical protein
MAQLIVGSFNSPDDTRTPPKARVEAVTVGDTTIARSTMEPGWRWSESVKPIVGTETCQHHHVGTVVSGRIMIQLEDGTERELGPNDVYDIPPGHDAWVLGDEPFVGIEVAQVAATTFAKA